MLDKNYIAWTKSIDIEMSLPLYAIGFCEEAGEVAGKVKKLYRDDGGCISPERREAILHELGDTVYYMARIIEALNSSFEEVEAMNRAKLNSRAQRGVLKGSGDNR
jgi:NTP pyrophosphatase (non-canonical NTP hydrolase)